MTHTLKKSKVYYWKDVKSMDYMVEGKTPTKEDFEKDYVKLPVETEEKELEQIWHDYNVGKSKHKLGTEKIQDWIRDHDLSHTSMSIGDVVQKNGDFYIARDVGWEKLKWKSPKMGKHKMKKGEESYWEGHWKVGEEISAGTNLDFQDGRGVIVEIDKDNPDWAKVKLKDGKITTAYKYGSYRLGSG
jgi:hypothetical protein